VPVLTFRETVLYLILLLLNIYLQTEMCATLFHIFRLMSKMLLFSIKTRQNTIKGTKTVFVFVTLILPD
jgi:hypothetical protein